MIETKDKITWGLTSGALLISVCSAVVSGFSLRNSNSAEARAERQEKQAVASQVHLQEAPTYVYAEHPKTGESIRWVVLNQSKDPIEDVWVEGKGSTSIRIQQVQGCTIYGLPESFQPVAVNFRDANGRWRRGAGVDTPTPNGKPLPRSDTDDSPWTMDVQAC